MSNEPTLNELMERSGGPQAKASDAAANLHREPHREHRGASARLFGHGVAALHDQPVDEEDSWVTTYMDLLTLLLVLFVILLANADLSGSPSPSEQVLQAAAGQSAGLALTESELQAQFASSGLADGVEVSTSPGKVNIKLKDKILFHSGEAEFNQQAAQVMQTLTEVLKKNQLFISVEGHTDNIPISNQRFPSNWELSAARASVVVRFLAEQGIAPERMRAVGYADSAPLQTNTTAAGRSENRRVNVVLTEVE
ncbi:OmpA family protein [Pseudidiomarina sp. GXY010]|uniref:OmpA family protein n=1 Tax=Pseudidiomarina fusca TaxID=2965078 RepID=A0ABU3KY56_9GAMM|nr:OmpA family protein [Pseudidiomarina sp. GXY010]MDT7526439.1 OmpA family protein [Pseudidiomarina sp. GXY010]